MDKINKLITEIRERFGASDDEVTINKRYLDGIIAPQDFEKICTKNKWEFVNRSGSIYYKVKPLPTHILLYLEHTYKDYDSRGSSLFGSASDVMSFWEERFIIGTHHQVMKKYNELKTSETSYKDLKVYELNRLEIYHYL